MDTTIYIATHKNFIVPNIKGYQPIEVGADIRSENLPYIRDNEGDNISNKNQTFCELTACYWIWKNSTADIVGLCHYRRYFSDRRVDSSQKYYLKTEEINNILKDYDVILPEPFYWRKHNVETGYAAGSGISKDLGVIGEIIKEKYPSFYNEYKIILKKNRISYCNMIITNKLIFDEYCSWVFDILFEAEKRIDISNYSVSEKRIFGYISEILLNVWVVNKNLKIYYKTICFVGNHGKKQKLLFAFDKCKYTRKFTKAINCMDGLY